MICGICIRYLAGIKRERAKGVVEGRGWWSPHWLMTESSKAPYSSFPPPTSPLERGEIQYIQHFIQLLCLMSNPSSEIQITQLSYCFRRFFPLHWSRRWKACTRQSQLQLFFDAFKSVTSSFDMRQEPKLRLSLFTPWVSNGKWKPLQCLPFSFHSLFSL